MEANNSRLNIYRLLRIAKDLKTKEVANELRVATAYVSAIEKGERTPSDRLRRNYAKLFQINEDYITSFVPEKDFEHTMLKLLEVICKAEEESKK